MFKTLLTILEEEKNEVKKVVDEALDENFAQLEELQSKNSDNEKAKSRSFIHAELQ